MENEKLREMKLTKSAKYGFITMFLVAIVAIAIAAIATRGRVHRENDFIVNVTPQEPDNDNDVVIKEDEKLIKPFTVDAAIKTYYFDINDKSINQENALIYYGGQYIPSKAVDYFYNNLAFDVVSVFSGTVAQKEVDPLYGATIYIKSDNNNLMAVYSSLSDISVNVGDKVSQGQIIAKAGNNTINSNMGNHLNFALLKDNKNINPLDYYNKVIKDI